jgi:hypothetical protein
MTRASVPASLFLRPAFSFGKPESGLPQEMLYLDSLRVFQSQNRYPPSDQVRGHAFAKYPLMHFATRGATNTA